MSYLVNEAGDEEFNNRIFEVIDKENFYSWTLHALLSDSRTEYNLPEMDWYADKETGKLNLMPWDVNIDDARPSFEEETYIFEEAVNPLVIRVFDNYDFLSERNELLLKYMNAEENNHSKLDYYDTLRQDNSILKENLERLKNIFNNPEVSFTLLRENIGAVDVLIGERFANGGHPRNNDNRFCNLGDGRLVRGRCLEGFLAGAICFDQEWEVVFF